MDAQIAKDLFHTARGRYDASLRWSLTAIATLAIFHLMVFWPYVALHSRYEATQALAADAQQQTDVVADLQAILTDGGMSVGSRMDGRLEAFVADLRRDMDDLDRTVRRIRSQSPIMPDMPDFGDRPLIQNRRMIQSNRLPGASDDSFSITDADLEARIRDAADMTQVLDAVQPVVVTEIVAPAFDALNQFWTDTLVVELNDQLDATETGLSEMQDDRLALELAPAITRLRTVSADVSFAPPSDPFWWTSVEGKEETAIEISDNVRTQLASPPALDAITLELEAIRARQKEVLVELESERKQLDDRFKQLQSDLTSLGQAFTAVAVDLDGVATRFPLLLAMVLAVAMAWTARRARDLTLATQSLFAIDEDQGLTSWLRRRTRVLASPRAEAWLFGGVGVLWIAVAIVQSSVFADATARSVVVTSLACAALIGAASWVRVRELRAT